MATARQKNHYFVTNGTKNRCLSLVMLWYSRLLLNEVQSTRRESSWAFEEKKYKVSCDSKMIGGDLALS
jgi:hypothetical protein